MKTSLPNPAPPRWATRLLGWYCAPHLLEEVQGDLQEEFEHQIEHKGLHKARLDYIRNVLEFIKPFAIKRKQSANPTPTVDMNMFKHYLTVAARNLVRHKSFSAINIVGLALGMTCCLFIFLWIKDEKSIDNFHTNGNKLFNVYETVNSNNVITGSYATTIRYTDGRLSIPIADIKQAVPEIEGIAFYATGYELPWGYPETFQVGDKLHKFEGSRASEDFFMMFSYDIIAGDRSAPLKDLTSIAISRKMAETFFDTPENAIGKSIRYENKIDFAVTSVFENVTPLSTMRFEFLINWESQMTRLAWASNLARTTLQIKEGADIKAVETKVNRFVQARLDQSDPRKISLGLQPFRDQYLIADFVNGKPTGGRIEYVKIFSGVGVFILLIACINFMNLATARSMKRAKEIGVRKVVGSTRGSLIRQFFGESMVLSWFAMLLSLVLVHLLLPAFNSFTAKQISSPISEPTWWLVMLCLMVFTGFVAGTYPALFLSSLKPVTILKGTLRYSSSSIWTRKGLAGFQFRYLHHPANCYHCYIRTDKLRPKRTPRI